MCSLQQDKIVTRLAMHSTLVSKLTRAINPLKVVVFVFFILVSAIILEVDYENNCRQYWVNHFDKQYCAKKRGLFTVTTPLFLFLIIHFSLVVTLSYSIVIMCPKLVHSIFYSSYLGYDHLNKGFSEKNLPNSLSYSTSPAAI